MTVNSAAIKTRPVEYVLCGCVPLKKPAIPAIPVYLGSGTPRQGDPLALRSVDLEMEKLREHDAGDREEPVECHELASVQQFLPDVSPSCSKPRTGRRMKEHEILRLGRRRRAF